MGPWCAPGSVTRTGGRARTGASPGWSSVTVRPRLKLLRMWRSLLGTRQSGQQSLASCLRRCLVTVPQDSQPAQNTNAAPGYIQPLTGLGPVTNKIYAKLFLDVISTTKSQKVETIYHSVEFIQVSSLIKDSFYWQCISFIIYSMSPSTQVTSQG